MRCVSGVAVVAVWTIYYVSFARAVKIHLDLRNDLLLCVCLDNNSVVVLGVHITFIHTYCIYICSIWFFFFFCNSSWTKLLSHRHMKKCVDFIRCREREKERENERLLVPRIQVQVVTIGWYFLAFFLFFIIRFFAGQKSRPICACSMLTMKCIVAHAYGIVAAPNWFQSNEMVIIC